VDLESRRDSIQARATVADVLWISGAVFVGAGVTLFVLDHRASESVAVQAGCFDAACGLQANGTF